MIEDQRDAIAAWATERGLTFEAEGLLPPVTDALRQGFGVGEHRAGVITHDEGGTFTAVGGFTTRPERSTWNLCSGRLPGGVEGVVAHHVHLERRSVGNEGQSWYAAPSTVVFAVLPDGARAVRWLTAVAGGSAEISAVATLDLRQGSPVPPVPAWRAEIAGVSWTATPAEDASRMERIAGPAGAALVAAPAGTRIELYDGALAVVARGVVDDPAALDAMCAVAAAVAAPVAAIVADDPPLDPTVAVGPPAGDARAAWLDEGVAQVTWSSPPASIDAAQAAYQKVAEGMARARGVRWKTRLIVLVAVLAGLALWTALDVAAILVFPDAKGELVLLLAVTLLFLVPGGIRVAWQAGSEVHSGDVSSRALPWGLEAFAREYATSRGLRLEDPVAFRHRLRSPIPGVPMRVMHGDLGGTPGWLALWADDTMPQRRHLLVAVLPVAAGPDATAPGYAVHERDGLLVLAEEVTASERTLARLDALRAAAVVAAAGPARA